MTQITPDNIPRPDDKSDGPLGGGSTVQPGYNPLGGDDLNPPFIPDEEPKDGDPLPQRKGPLNPQHDHEKTPRA